MTKMTKEVKDNTSGTDITEWDIVEPIDDKLGTDKKLDIESNINAEQNNDIKEDDDDLNSDIDEFYKEEMYFSGLEFFQNKLALINKWNIYLIAKAIVGIILIIISYTVINNAIYSYRIENMVGTIDYFPANSKYIKVHMNKCQDVFDHNQKFLDDCIENNLDTSGCLNRYMALIEKNKDFCNWDAFAIEKRQKYHIIHASLTKRINKLTDASKTYVNKLHDIYQIGSEYSYKICDSIVSTTDKQFNKSIEFLSKKVKEHDIKNTFKRFYKDSVKMLNQYTEVLSSVSVETAKKLRSGVIHFVDSINKDNLKTASKKIQDAYKAICDLF
jgi:hypothetical protein